jgi:metallophosphoesterase (TIGR00282 family)
MALRILCLGDIVGRPGRQVVHQKLPALVKQRQIDLVIANAENIAGGSDIVPTLQASERIVRPANLSAGAAGRPFTVVQTNSGALVAVFCLLGRIYMNLPSDDPFAAANRVLQQLPAGVRITVCDMHAEASSEKVAMGHHLDGRCSVIFGTHTHIPTADAKILPGGSAYISDLGMCGPYDSVLGRRKERVLKFMTTNMPAHFEVATGDVRMCGALIEVDESNGRAVAIERIEVQGESVDQAYDADDKNPTPYLSD